MCAFIYACRMCAHVCPQRPENDIGSPGAGLQATQAACMGVGLNVFSAGACSALSTAPSAALDENILKKWYSACHLE